MAVLAGDSPVVTLVHLDVLRDLVPVLLADGPEPEVVECSHAGPDQRTLVSLFGQLKAAGRYGTDRLGQEASCRGCRRLRFSPPTGGPVTHDEALKELSRLAHERAFGGYIGSDTLIQAGLDALLAGVESESLAMPAGLGRNLGYPDELHSLVVCAYNLDMWDENWGVPVAKLKSEAIEAAAHFLKRQSSSGHG